MFIGARPVNADDVAEFVGWRYEAPYDAYNLTRPLVEVLDYFLGPTTKCHGILTDAGLGGYCTFGEDARVPGGDYQAAAVDIGAALKPELVGRGYGTEFVAAIIECAILTFDPSMLRVSISASNPRAMKVWMSNGFNETQRFHAREEMLGTKEFVIFERSLGE